MAAGFTSALERLATIIQKCDSTANWKRTEQRISSLRARNAISSGIDHKFWIGTNPKRTHPAAIAGNLLTIIYHVEIELARYWGGGDKHSKDYYGLLKTLEAEAITVEQNILYSKNWDYANTGIILINQSDASTIQEPEDDRPIFLWLIPLTVNVRQAKVAAAIS